MVDVFSVNPSTWYIEGNVITDELDDPSDYTLFKSSLVEVPVDSSTAPIVGDTSIKVETLGESPHEGIMESPSTVDVDSGDSVWHSIYLKGSGVVILQCAERDLNGVLINTSNSPPFTLSNVYQLLELNTIIDAGVLCSFKVLTNGTDDIVFNLNGVYVNKGSTSRTGLNLVSDNVASTGGNGSTDGFIATNGAIISSESDVNTLEMDYSETYSKVK